MFLFLSVDHLPFSVLKVDHPVRLMAEAVARQKPIEAVGRELGAVGHNALFFFFNRRRAFWVGHCAT